jgi:isocitrate dehydrogenase (NAD+)
MKLGDGLFLNTFRRVAEEYKSSGIEFNDMIVDNTYGSNFSLVLPYLFKAPALCNSSPAPANST